MAPPDLAHPAGDKIEKIRGPSGNGGEAVVARADAGINDAGRRVCKFVGKSSNGLGVNTYPRCNAFRREGDQPLADLSPATSHFVDAMLVDFSFVDKRLHHGDEERCISSGTDCNPFIGLARRFGTPRVDHDDAAAPLAYGAQSPTDIGRRHQAAVRDPGIGADAKEILRSVDIGHGHDERGAVEKVGYSPAGARVLRAGPKAIP